MNSRLAKTTVQLVSLLSIVCNMFCSLPAHADSAEHKLDKIKHVIVIYMENWSFDSLYGLFPGADGIQNINAVAQLDTDGRLYKTLPPSPNYEGKIDKRIPANLPVRPFNLEPYIAIAEHTGDPIHRFYQQQTEIDGGKMDRFVSESTVGGLSMSYYDARKLPQGKWASEYTLCDHFFQAAFGGSWLNNAWLLTARTPEWKNAPDKETIRFDPNNGELKDGRVTGDGYVVNNAKFPPPQPPSQEAIPLQTYPTICDRLNEKNISWAWYGNYAGLSLLWFKNFQYGEVKCQNIRTQDVELLSDLKTGKLPSVSFVHFIDGLDEHPGYSTIAVGEKHLDLFLRSIKNSPYWKDSVIIVTYDENGGRWDHMAPPKRDRFGPGTRVPTLVISPLAKKHFVDHTVYDTTSILKLIETRWHLQPLTDADAKVNNLTNALQL